MAKLSVNFWGKVSIGDGCWLWSGGKMKNGYANFFIGKKSQRVHRLSYQHYFGSIPNGLGVLHKCDVRNCIRPDHLFTGTQKDNLQDCKIKGRTTIGIKNAMAKLDDEKASLIRKLYSSGGITQRTLATQFGITQSNVSRLVGRKHWTHIQ